MSSSKKRVLVTGATGLIGKELAEPLHEAGFDVYAITIDEINPANGINWVRGNLFDERFVGDVMADLKPTHLLNMAWATTGDYLSSDINYKFLAAGISLAEAFAKNGGKRAVYAGTCFEYKFKDEPLSETDELDPGKFTYTFCKDALRRIVSRYFESHGISFAYGRIFYVFGNGEATTRLTGMLVDKLCRGERVSINSGSLLRDYLYSKDIAGAFSALLSSATEGCVNVCSGKEVSIRDYALKVARSLGREELVEFCDAPSVQPRRIIGNNARLTDEVGYEIKWPIDVAIEDIVRSVGKHDMSASTTKSTSMIP